MNSNFDSYTWWHNNLRMCWIVLPVLAHIISWLTGMGGIFFFPILITIAQYLIFKIHPAVARPGLWFLTLPLTFFIWMKWGPFIDYLKPDGVLHGVMAYYAGQLVNALFIPLVAQKERPEFLLNWLICTSITALSWLGAYWVAIHWLGIDELHYGLFIMYPTIALLANWISSFFLLEE
ncbi:hypothetical protein [Spirosoma foliorum]|uniref:Uncharacterized protein n=1 Tax=Spirosoma foliorum TaxID=2710596 RepID=A0A7G5GXU4_9BACT|nr:hypothetical protein [Spirosoma foliorum]QMW03686.1 hypothetical protein H3H32_01645 [Spirosoma foliorum]